MSARAIVSPNRPAASHSLPGGAITIRLPVATQLARRRGPADGRLVERADWPRVEEAVLGLAIGSLLEQADVLRDGVHAVGSDRARGSGGRSADAREARVAATEKTVDGRLEVGEGEGPGK